MAKEESNLFDAVRKANRAVWEQASGRKPSDESRAIPPPTGRESPLEGADASAMVAALSAKLSDLQARVDYIEDDFPESEIGGGDGDSGAGSVWSGIVWHLGNILYDFNKTDNSPLGSASEYGLVGVSEDFVYSGSVLGEYLKIKLNDGSMAWVDGADIVTSIADIDDKDEYEYFRVATIAGKDSASHNIYVLAENRTVGDIRIPYAPYIAEIEEQEE